MLYCVAFAQQVMRRKQEMVFLLRSSCEKSISLRKLMLLLTPVFSERGSNKRSAEDESYKIFVNYLRDVTGTTYTIGLLNIFQCIVIHRLFSLSSSVATDTWRSLPSSLHDQLVPPDPGCSDVLISLQYAEFVYQLQFQLFFFRSSFL